MEEEIVIEDGVSYVYRGDNIIKSYTDMDYIEYYYDELDRIYYEKCFDIYDKLLREVWFYYDNIGNVDHIVTSDGFDIWLDDNGNKIPKKL